MNMGRVARVKVCVTAHADQGIHPMKAVPEARMDSG